SALYAGAAGQAYAQAENALYSQPSGLDADAAGQALHRPPAKQDTNIAIAQDASIPGRLIPVIRGLYLLLEAQAADIELLRRLPGAAADIAGLRRWMLERHLAKPPSLAAVGQALQALKLSILQAPPDQSSGELPYCATPEESVATARRIALHLATTFNQKKLPHRHALLLDAWTGDLHAPHQRPLLEQQRTPAASD